MGNKVSSSAPSFGRVILPDGRVREVEEEMTVAELMMEYPQQVVVEFDRRAVNGKRPMPLHADKKLEMNKVYLLVPKKKGKPTPLSSEQARHLLLMANSILTSKPLLTSTTGVLPIFARICTAYTKDTQKIVHHHKEKVTGKGDEVAVAIEPEFPEVSDERPMFYSRQMSGKGWKPSLEPIKETIVNKKVSHWLVM